jgi:hypothetical protein
VARRGSVALAVSAVLLGTLAAAASAAPTAKLSVHVQPVTRLAATCGSRPAVPGQIGCDHAEPGVGYPHTGSRDGAGASLLVEVGLSGTEYAGGPPPLNSVSLLLPAGMRWDTAGMPKCVLPELEIPAPFSGPCDQLGVHVRPDTLASGHFQFGMAFVPEMLSVESADDKVGGTVLLVGGHIPVSLEFQAEGTVARHSGQTELRWPMPLVETVPGGLDGSMNSLALRLGSGVVAKHGTKFSLHMPAKCPRGGLRFRLAVEFAPVAGLPAQTAAASYGTPCPRA